MKIFYLIGERYGFDARFQQLEMALGIIVHKQQNSAGNDESILALKATCRVIQIRNRGYQWPHKMDLGSTENLIKKKKKEKKRKYFTSQQYGGFTA